MSQALEHQADQFGLMLHFNAVRKASAALESAIYFQHAIGLLDARLGLLSDLVDEYHRKIAHAHPPWLARLCARKSGRSLRRGSSKDLLEVHGDLSEVDMKIRQTANAQQAETVAAVRALIKAEATIVGREDRHAERAPSAAGEQGPLRQLSPETAEEVRRLLERSTLGVLRALDPPRDQRCDDPTEGIVEAMALTLPAELQQFR